MNDDHQRRFRDAEIDSSLFSCLCGIQTNWYVLTGAPCSGKTTLIKQFAERGFQTLEEVGRRHIASELAKGRTLAELRGNEAIFQRTLLDLRLEREHGLNPVNAAFLDRGLPDSLTFYRANGLDPNGILAECLHYRYASVFLLDRLPLEMNGVRSEDEAVSEFIDEWLFRDYTALGYDVERVPVLPIKERLTFILERVPKKGRA